MRKIKNLIIGSGPAGLATAMALRSQGESFELLDVAYDLEENIGKQVNELANLAIDEWPSSVVKKIFPPPNVSSAGVEKRYQFGSDFPYRVPDNLQIESDNCKVDFSHAYGGLGNVWGAAILPYSRAQLSEWPIGIENLKASYSNVAEYIPVSGEMDGLKDSYPLFKDEMSQLNKNALTTHLMRKLNSRKQALNLEGIEFGRARLAVDSSGRVNTCRYCGRCLDGCPFGSIFNPRQLWKKLESENIRIHRGMLALELLEDDAGSAVIAVDLKSKAIRKIHAKRIFLATGQYATTTILARSFDLRDVPIKIQDSQYFYFPFFTYRGHRAEIDFTLAEAFMEINNKKVSNEQVHLQFYGKNHIIEREFTQTLPWFVPKNMMLDRLYIFQGFLSSKDSGYLELSLSGVCNDSTSVRIKGIENAKAKSTAKSVQFLLRKALINIGVIPPFNLAVVPPGRSFHTGGSFPMGGHHKILSSDRLGRPGHFKNIHIVDSANFPNIAGSTIAYTIMANADRIVRELGNLK